MDGFHQHDGDAPRRVRRAVALLVLVLVGGTIGYMVLGLDALDAAYQAATTVSTVGFRELGAPTAAWKAYTIVVVLVGAGTVVYAVSALLELVIETSVTDRLGRRRMEREINGFRDHVIVCGYGRVGQAITSYLDGTGQDVVVVDRDPARARDLRLRHVVGDATDDTVLRHAGIERAATLI